MSDFKPNEKGFAQLEEALSFGLLNLGLAIEADAKARVPFVTGNLRRSIHTAGYRKGSRFYGAVDDNGKAIPQYAQNSRQTMVVVGTNAGYGVFVELGTIHMAAQPYLGPALNDNRSRAGALVKAGMQRKLG